MAFMTLSHVAYTSDQVIGSILEPVERYAPIFLAERSCAYNIPTQVSFDGDWSPLNNESSYEALIDQYGPFILDYPDLFEAHGISSVYYEVVASVSHIFVTYYLFYPHDAGDGCQYSGPEDPGGHQNDASSVMLILRRDTAGPFIEWVVTMDHGFVAVSRPEEALMVDGKPVIAIRNGTHQMMALRRDNLLLPGEFYYRFGLDVRYSLEPIFTALWPQRANDVLFCLFSKGIGIQYCEEKNKAKGRGTPPWAPWAREFKPGKLTKEDLLKARGLAESFFDPIGAFESLYPDGQVYSSEYIYNPYIDLK
jgi:hypothetical protein